MKTNKTEAIIIMLTEYGRKRREIAKDIQVLENELSGLRANAKNRHDVLNRIECRKNWLKETEEQIHAIDTFETIADQYEDLSAQISDLCEKRRALFDNQVIVSQFEAAKRNGFVSVF